MNKETKPKYGIAVDAACSGNPGMLEFRGIHIATGEEVFHYGPMLGTNNIGECLAVCIALFMYGDKMPIYTDSKTALAWIRDLKHKSTLKETIENNAILTLLNISLAEVSKYTRDNVRKWNTKAWGEIPADFGRKK